MARRLMDGGPAGARPAAPLGTDPARPSTAPAAVGDGFLRRVWSRPLWAHALGLAVVLLALVPFVGTGASFSADEGAAIIQARNLARGEGWVVDHPVPEVDPDGRYYPLELSAAGPEGTAPFAKHPLYAVLLAGADRVGGVAAMVLLSVMGTTAAAALAGALARRLSPSLARPALWTAGLGSPLLFDGYLVIAHALGAALAAGAVLCGLRALDGPSPRRVVVSCVALAACLAAAVLLRSEATLFALALAATWAVVAGRRRSLPALVVAVTCVVAGGAAWLLEGRGVRHLLGGVPTTTGSFEATASGLAGRWDGFRLTWLTPSYNGPTAHDVALVAVLALVVAAAVVVRRRPSDGGGLVLLSAAAATAALVALAAGADVLTPGLAITFPLAVAGVLVVRRRSLPTPAGTVAAGTFALFAAAVLATQYPQGGSGEWGGRYFALGVPLLVPVALAGLAGQRERVRRTAGRVAVAALVVCTAAVSTTAVSSLRSHRRFTAGLVARVDAVGNRVAGATDGAGGASAAEPILVTTSGAVPRLAWDGFERQRWLLADEDDPTALPDLVVRLRAAGVTRFGLVTNHLPRDGDQLGPGSRVVYRDGRRDGTDWQMLVVELA